MFKVVLKKIIGDDVLIGFYESQIDADNAIQKNKHLQKIYYVGEETICDSFWISYVKNKK